MFSEVELPKIVPCPETMKRNLPTFANNLHASKLNFSIPSWGSFKVKDSGFGFFLLSGKSCFSLGKRKYTYNVESGSTRTEIKH